MTVSAEARGLVEAADALKSGAISSAELTDACLRRIERLDPTLNAFVTVVADQAMAAAWRADRDIRRGGARSPIHGVPVAIKDMFDTRAVPTMANSRVWADRVPTTTATAVRRIEQAGGILVGKLQMSEFAIGAASEDDLRPPARNPWAADRSPGGSSSGSAVALASTLCFGSLGSDTGGSIRAPASHCGVVGLKPTLGRVSRHGMAMLSWSLDHAGPMGRRVEDVAALLTVIAGHDVDDPASSRIGVSDYLGALRRPVRGLTIGVPRRFIATMEVEESVAAAFDAGLDALAACGANVVDVDLPALDTLDAVFNPLLFAEAVAVHGDALQTGAPYGSNFRRRVLQGYLLSAVDYVHAQRGRTRLIRQFKQLMQSVDVLATPTMGIAGPPLGADPNSVRSPFTRIFNVTGQPSISVPCGFTGDGMPIGLMFSGRWFDEATVLRIAFAFEDATSWHQRLPPILEVIPGA